MDRIVQNSASQEGQKETDGQDLVDHSPKDRPWDVHRGQADDVSRIYAAWVEFERLAARMVDCAGLLRFALVVLAGTGEAVLRLREAFFCRVRHCPICQWRRSMMWQARFYQALPEITAAYPKARWIFLTLTVRNCPITELGTTLTDMNMAWKRLVLRNEFKSALGWVRATEVTRGDGDTAHPHFHAMLMVSPSYFTKDYVKQSRWSELWGECLRVNYLPIVDVRTIKGDLSRAVQETLKYSVKPQEMIDNPEWFLEMTKQVHRRRFIATGGVLKDVLKVDEENDADMVMADNVSDAEDDGARVAFSWNNGRRRYRRSPNLDIEPRIS